MEETASFLQSLLASHGPNYLEKLFGSKARDALEPLGGVEKVAIALSESQTIEDFGAALHLMRYVKPPAVIPSIYCSASHLYHQVWVAVYEEDERLWTRIISLYPFRPTTVPASKVF